MPRFLRTRCLPGLVIILGASLLGGAARAGAADENSKDSLWGKTLAEYVHGGRVDYPGLKKNRAGLDGWLESAAVVSEADFSSWPRERRLAFLLNVYNAATLRLIIDRYPVASIRTIGPFWDPKGPWHLAVVRLFGRSLTLDELEQGIIRPRYKEPRAHFALVCAAKGCPPLRSELYAGGRLSAQLDEQAHLFLSQESKNRADRGRETAFLSPIFKWYMEDFGGSKKTVLAFVRKWMMVEDGWDVEWTEYDWSLNEDKR